MKAGISLAGQEKSATLTKGRQFHAPKPPPVAFHMKPADAGSVAAAVFDAVKRSAYRHGCTVALYWFIDSGSVYLMPANHQLSPTWGKHHPHAHVGTYGFVHSDDGKMLRPDLERMSEDLSEHAATWIAP